MTDNRQDLSEKAKQHAANANGAAASSTNGAVSARQPMARSSAARGADGSRQPIIQARAAQAGVPGGEGAGSHRLSAEEYARTTQGRADSTSVIPAVTDEPEAEVTREQRPVAAAASRTRTSAKGAVQVTEAEPTRQLTEDEYDDEPGALRLSYIEPWSVTRLAFVVSVALMIVSVVAMTVFWLVLQATGVWGAVNDSVTNVLADDSGNFDITEFLGFGRLVGLTLILSALNVVFMTALATISAHLYNMAAGILGGVEVSFSDDE